MNSDGYGYGYGDGSGYGSGYSYGDGYGDGDGYGYGYDCDDGDGHGDGYGETIIEPPGLFAWHCVSSDGTLRYAHDGDRVEVEEGLVLSVDPDEMEVCTHGLHASHSLDQARFYNDGLPCRVRVWGRVIFEDDKFCAEYREVIEIREDLM